MSKRRFGNHLAFAVLTLLTCSAAVYSSESKKSETSEVKSTSETKTELDKAGRNESSKTESKTGTSTETSTSASSVDSASTKSGQGTDETPHQSALPENWVPAKIIEEKPKEKPAPPGQAAAVKLYSQRKFAQAAAEFEKFVNNGTANAETHAYLAYCDYNTRKYTKALQQFNWVAKNCPDNYKLRTNAERYVSLLRTEMAGICPQPCLKPNDPRWQRYGNHMEIRWSIKGGWIGVTDHHVGELITVRNDQIVNQGTCPTCGGTGTITPLRDGAPLPN